MERLTAIPGEISELLNLLKKSGAALPGLVCKLGILLDYLLHAAAGIADRPNRIVLQSCGFNNRVGQRISLF